MMMEVLIDLEQVLRLGGREIGGMVVVMVNSLFTWE